MTYRLAALALLASTTATFASDVTAERAAEVASATMVGLQGEDNVCAGDIGAKPEVTEVKVREATNHLVQVPCQRYAYGESLVSLLVDEYENARILSFAEPVVDWDYADEKETVLNSFAITGWTANVTSGARYDAAKNEAVDYVKWRGLGDVFQVMTYRFENGRFELVKMVADPTWDGKITEITIYEGGAK